MGGSRLFSKYSLFDLKCLACPEGKLMFDNKKQSGYWENQENILNFLSEIKEKYNVNTPEDWNSITTNHISSNGGRTLLTKYSMFDLKCMACPEGKSIFNNPPLPPGYWENKENIQNFLSEIREKYNLNTIEDWNSITKALITSNGGWRLFSTYTIYDLKCMACPEGKLIFDNNPKQSSVFWEDQDNINQFLSEIKEKYNLHTPEDWKRISIKQINSEGGYGLFTSSKYSQINLTFNNGSNTNIIPFSKLIERSPNKRSSQRWLFLQIQKLFPDEELVEDYYHSELSRISGVTIQFDIFMINRNIAIEYHGKHHYEDIPSFGSLETYKHRDLEKEMLCEQHNIQLIVIPYWWNNKMNSLETFLYSKMN